MYNHISKTDRKLNKSREWIYNEYVVKGRKREEVARECGLTLAGFKSALSKYNIQKPKLEISIQELEQLLREGNSVEEIARRLNCSETSIYRRMAANNLTINYIPDYKQYDNRNDELICSLYLDGCSPENIGKELGISRTSVKNHLVHCGIHLRSYSEAQWNYNNKILPKEFEDYNIMYDLYIVQKRSKKELGIKFNTDAGVIDRILRNLNIPVRGVSETQIGQRIGNLHPNWQGGITPLLLRLRTAFEVQLRPKAIERDNHTCQLCESTDNICVHHVRPLKEIVDEICSEHPTLDIINDVNQLYTIIIKDTRFTDLNNLITCCKNCHLYTLHGYRRSN